MGYPMLPVYMSKMGGFLFITFGVIALDRLAVHDQPDLELRSVRPSPVSAGTQPDWYIGFADGALRLVPPGWEFVFLDRTWSFNIIVPPASGSVCSSSSSLIYPFIEAWITGDKREHHRPAPAQRGDAHRRSVPAGVTFYAVLWAAGGLRHHRRPTSTAHDARGVIHTLQALLFIGPIIAYFVTKRHLHRAAEEGPRDRAARLRSPVASSASPAASTSRCTSPSTSTSAGSSLDRNHLRAAGRPPERQGTHPVAREPACVRISRSVLRGSLTLLTQSEVDAARGPPAPRAGPHRRREEDTRDPGVPERAGVPDAPAQADRRRPQLARPPVAASNLIVPSRRRGRKPANRARSRTAVNCVTPSPRIPARKKHTFATAASVAPPTGIRGLGPALS